MLKIRASNMHNALHKAGEAAITSRKNQGCFHVHFGITTLLCSSFQSLSPLNSDYFDIKINLAFFPIKKILNILGPKIEYIWWPFLQKQQENFSFFPPNIFNEKAKKKKKLHQKSTPPVTL